MEVFEAENKKISYRYYNAALKSARERDLFNASILLKKSLLFNKKNANARNLLALIFYEEGAITDAIVQWLISRDISGVPANPAIAYLKKIQRDEDTNYAFESVKTYNSAIDDVEIERYDLAMVKLFKAVELNKHNVKAMMLLSLILIKIGENVKAGAYLMRAQKIDVGNRTINEYLNYVYKNTKQGEIREKKLKNVFSLQKIEADDTILPQKYIKLSENQKVIFILIGLVLGIFSYAFILSPFAKGNTNIDNDKEVIKYANLVNDQNKIIRDITIENDKLKTSYADASVKLEAYENQNKVFTSQYESLNSIITDFDNGYISRAAKAYVELDKDSITDEMLITLLNQAKSRIEGIGAKKLCELGTESWNGGNKNAAISYYQLSLSINPDDPETMFLLARLYQSLDRNKEANEIFDKIIAQHPQSNYAKRSREARGY